MGAGISSVTATGLGLVNGSGADELMLDSTIVEQLVMGSRIGMAGGGVVSESWLASLMARWALRRERESFEVRGGMAGKKQVRGRGGTRYGENWNGQVW